MNESSNRIKGYKLYSATAKLDKPISDATHTLHEISFLVLRIQAESGITGESYLLSFQYSPNAIRGAFKDLLPLIMKYEVSEIGKVSKLLNDTSEYFGQDGINRWVQGAVNIALWDAWAKTLGRPVHSLFGLHKDSVTLYGSGGWLSYSIDELVRETSQYVSKGFKSVKIKVGSPNWKTDLHRIKKVREAVGSDVNIMIDANQGMDVPSACQLAMAAEEIGVLWFEEPLNHQDFEGFQSIKNRSGISLAMGEREYDMMALKELIRRKAIDIWQPDILRIGGVDAWRKSAALAESYHIPVLPHYYKDYDVPLLCTIPNGIGAESFDWIDPLVDNPMTVKDGFAYPHNSPGWGFTFLDKYLNEITF